MKIFRLTVKSFALPAVPPGYPMHGTPARRRIVYRIRRDGQVIGSGVCDDTAHPDKMLSRATA